MDFHEYVICDINDINKFISYLHFLPRLHSARWGEAAEWAGACVFTRPLKRVCLVGWVQHAEAPVGVVNQKPSCHEFSEQGETRAASDRLISATSSTAVKRPRL